MSTYYYVLRIYVPKNIHPQLVSDKLNVIPTKSKDKIWEYELVEKEGDTHIDFISTFVNILSKKNLEALRKLGINKDVISLWLYYEYESQCNMEISPRDMRKLGDLNLSLCISCWQK